MMISAIASFISSIVFFLKPSLYVCGTQEILLGQCLGTTYIPLLLKTVRVYHIFEASKNFVRNPLLTSTRSQLLICFLGTFAHNILGVLLAASNPSKVSENTVENYTKVAIFCQHYPINAVTCLVPCLLLLLACTLFGYKTRKFPSDFNESFRISITMYISCFLWGVYVPLLYLFETSQKNAFLSSFITAGLMIALGFVNLIGIFGATMLKALENRQTRPEPHVSSSTFASFQGDHITTVDSFQPTGKSFREIGTHPIEFH